MIILGAGIVLALLILFIGRIHGYPGAVILGLTAGAVDFLIQWIRFKLVPHNNTKYLVLATFGGLGARVLSILLFLTIGSRWLGSRTNYFLVFAIFLLLIAFWSKFAAFKFKSERDHDE